MRFLNLFGRGLFVFIIAGFSLFVSCDDSEENGSDPVLEVKADAGSDLEVDVDEEVVLDGSGSMVSAGSAAYMWEVLSAPSGSNAFIQSNASVTALFVPEMAGEYEISLMVLAGKEVDSDTITITAVSSGPIALDCSDINENMTLENIYEGVDYYVPCMIQVNAGLIIDPGVTIEFAQGAGFEFQTYGDAQGYILAEGTEQDSIRFTGEIKTPGAWENLLIESDDLRNSMKYCIVEYAGTQDGSEAAIHMDDNSNLELQNSMIRMNSGYGMFIQNSGTNISGFSENTFTKNQNYPLHIAANKVGTLDGTNSTYTGNETSGGESRDEIYVFSNSIYERGYVTGQEVHEWEDPGVPFFINELVYVGETDEGGLRIHGGCEISFGQNYGFWVDEYNASFEILGTEENPVTVRGRNGQGSWNGIYIDTNNTLNKIENAVIKDGGQTEVGHWFDNPANINLGYPGSDVQLTLNNVEINNSGGCGIAEGGGTINLSATNVTYSGNVGNDYCSK